MTRPILSALLLFSLASVRAELVDTFGGGDWKRSEDTPGTFTAEFGRLRLLDGPEPPEWVMAAKMHEVDFDQTPVFLVKVAAVTEKGTVKLIRQKPKDKRDAISIDRPGLYAIDVRKEFGWTGTGKVEACLYAEGDQGDITFEFVKYVSGLGAGEEKEIAGRIAAGNGKLQVAPFELVPLFNSCSFYFISPKRDGLTVKFRRQGGEWQKAYTPVYMAEDNMYRGSVVHLDEDTGYELQITEGRGAELARGEFRTWGTDVPVAETIVLDESNFSGHLQITKSGTPEGWIRYTSKDGFVLRNDRKGPLVELLKAKYVILDGLTLRGGSNYALTIKRCEHVRIVNCDIAGWGRIGTQRFDLNGMYYTAEGEPIDWDTAILISRSLGTVVERCYIHDPVSTANSWYYAHPAGPQAVGIDKPRSTVLRYNDFVGSDEHRWNDGVEGTGNFDPDGGFNRDADIYGNFICFANDDAVEMDGGQTNVRVFQNWFEGCLCGPSIQGCMSGPSYVFDNLLVNMGDERGYARESIKTSSPRSGPGAVSFIFGNTSFGEASDLRLLKHLRIVARNNLFAGYRNITGQADSPNSDCDFNLQAAGKKGSEEVHGLFAEPGLVDPSAGLYALREDSPGRGRAESLENFTAGQSGQIDLGISNPVMPVRSLPVELDRNQLRFTRTGTSGTVTATVRGDGFKGRYRIAQNEAFDWFTVTPSEGVLESGATQKFSVQLRPERMKARALSKGAFLIRFADGVSRPVMVYAETGYQQAVKPAGAGIWSQFVEAEAPSGGKAYEVFEDAAASGGQGVRLAGPEGKNLVEYRFSVPRAGKYYAQFRVRAEDSSSREADVHFGLDKEPLGKCAFRISEDWRWCMASQNDGSALTCLQSWDLAVGDHVLKMAPRDSVQIDLVAITDNPKIFE
jgi:hypothetical protein